MTTTKVMYVTVLGPKYTGFYNPKYNANLEDLLKHVKLDYNNIMDNPNISAGNKAFWKDFYDAMKFGKEVTTIEILDI